MTHTMTHARHPGTLVRLAMLCSCLLVAALLGPGSGVPSANAAVDPALKSDTRFTAEPLPSPQTNGVVYAIESVGDVVYVGGNFSQVRKVDGTSAPRKNMAAFNAATGELLPFSHTFSAPDIPVPADGSPYDKTCSPGTAPKTYTCDTVYEIRASRDGQTLYVGGDFQKVDGQSRGNLAAFSLPGGGLTSFAVDQVHGRVRALAVSDTRLYFGGHVNEVADQPREHLAAVDRTTGALTGWRPRTDGSVIALALNGAQTRVMIGGDFDHVNGVRHRGVMAVSPGTGANTRWDSNPLPGQAGGPRSFVTDFAVSGNTVYVSAEGLLRFDGRVALDSLTGRTLWKNTCRGATWAIEKVGTLLYTGSHAHNCSRVRGGFGETANNLTDPADTHWHRFQAEAASDGAPALKHWFPTTNGGIVGSLGPRDLAWSRSANVLWAGGEFTTVNDEPQQGLVRFGAATSAASQSATPEKPSAPLVVSDTPGQVKVSWEATFDMDNAALTYTLRRNGTAVATRTASSDHDATRPTMSFLDSEPEPGQTFSYSVVARDAFGQVSPVSTATSVVTEGSTSAYRAALRADKPALHWPLDDQADRVAGGLVNGGGSGRYTSTGVTRGVPGAVDAGRPGTAVALNGTTGMARARHKVTAPSTFTSEIWFRGTGAGKIAGFGSSNTTTSPTADRHLYVDTSGHLVFGVLDRAGARRVLRSPSTVNDNQWHHAVAGVGPAGMRLFLDGQRVARSSSVTAARSYTGYWQLGGDSLAGWSGAPAQPNYSGSLDEFAIYHRELSGTEVAHHFDAANPS